MAAEASQQIVSQVGQQDARFLTIQRCLYAEQLKPSLVCLAEIAQPRHHLSGLYAVMNSPLEEIGVK